jgi:hypothetical protein
MADNQNVKSMMILQKEPLFESQPSAIRTDWTKPVAIKEKGELSFAFFVFGGADGARTRDPRRDRPVF